MIKQRIITALVLLPVVLGVFFMLQLEYFAAVSTVIVYLLSLEWAKVAELKASIQRTIFALVVSSINLFIWYFGGEFILWPSPSWPQVLVFDAPMISLAAACIVIILAVLIVATYSAKATWWQNKWFLQLLGIGLLPAFFVSLVSIRAVSYLSDFYRGGALLLLMFCIVWAADTGAFIAGKALGKRKLAPQVSPNKTWEGAIGGFFLSFLVGWAGVYFLRIPVTNPIVYSLVIIMIAVMSIMGDLFESALKRAAQIKDSGSLLPGHGGLFDRLDSALVVAPIFFLCFSYFGWFR